MLRHLHVRSVPLHLTNALAFLVSFVEVLLSRNPEEGTLISYLSLKPLLMAIVKSVSH